MSIKVCTKCTESKPINLFKKTKYGHGSWCKKCHSISVCEYQKRNNDKVTKNKKNWLAKNKKWSRSLDRVRRRMRHKNQKPKWCQYDLINKFYKDCPNGMVVDHVVPLRGKIVSGLHVIENLQYLGLDENRKKNNIF